MILHDEAQVRTWLRDAVGCDTVAFSRLERLLELLRDENRRQNLVSTASLAEAWVRHVADSAQLLLVSRGTPAAWLDLGAGAGFPGLVIGICRPTLSVTLVESRSRRVDWLLRVSDKLGLENVSVERRRVELISDQLADVISARAFAPLPRLIALSARFSTADTQWLLPKGRNGVQELQAMPATIKAMFHVEHSVTDCDSVILVGKGAIAAPRRPR